MHPSSKRTQHRSYFVLSSGRMYSFSMMAATVILLNVRLHDTRCRGNICHAKIRYYDSDTVLNVHSDASYLTAPNAPSRAGSHFFLGSLPKDGCPIGLNGTILTNCTIINCVAASVAEAELNALFLNASHAKEQRRIGLTLLTHKDSAKFLKYIICGLDNDLVLLQNIRDQRQPKVEQVPRTNKRQEESSDLRDASLKVAHPNAKVG